MPMAHWQTEKNWYTEVRYNYEDLQTFSMLVGKTFRGSNRLSYTLTPMAGGAVGRFKGISTGLNLDLEYDKFFFSSQSQYSYSVNAYNPSCLYSWSEIGYQRFRWLYTGFSVQQTYSRPGSLLEPGVMVGFSFGKYTIPIYSFDPLNRERYFIVGLTVQWQQKKSASPQRAIVTATNDVIPQK